MGKGEGGRGGRFAVTGACRICRILPQELECEVCKESQKMHGHDIDSPIHPPSEADTAALEKKFCSSCCSSDYKFLGMMIVTEAYLTATSDEPTT